MNAKQYLNQIRRLDGKIKHKLEDLDEYKRKINSVSAIVYDKEPVQTSASNSRVPDMVNNLVEMENKIKQLIEEYVIIRNRIVNEIDDLENDLHREILYMRYVKGESLLNISDALNYSYDRVRHLHGNALSEFSKKHCIGRIRKT